MAPSLDHVPFIEQIDDNILLQHALVTARPLIVVFSSVNSNGFSFRRSLEKQVDINVLYVRDPEDAWYHRGVSGELNNISFLAARLREIITEVAPPRVLTFGSSMGAYASLVFGTLLEADRIVAISPQTIIDTRLPHTPNEQFLGEYFDVRALLSYSHLPRERYALFCGGADLVDVYNSFRVQDFVDKIYTLEGEDHLVAAHLTKRGIINALIGELDGAPFALDMTLSRFTSDGLAVELAQRAVEGFYIDGPYDPEETCGALIRLHGDWDAAQHFMSGVLHKRRDLPGALTYAKRAAELNKNSITIANWYAEMLLDCGDEPGAITALLCCLKLRPGHYSALCRLASIYARNGNVGGALELLDRAIAVRPRLDRAKKLRLQVLKDNLKADLMDDFDKNDL